MDVNEWRKVGNEWMKKRNSNKNVNNERKWMKTGDYGKGNMEVNEWKADE